MTLGELKQMVLRLLDDKPHKTLTERFHTLMNIGQFEIATTCTCISKRLEIVHEGGTKEYPMPEDFYVARRVLLAEEGENFRNIAVTWNGRNCLILQQSGRYRVEYKAYPTPITEDTQDDFVMELPVEAQHALPFYVAAQICATDEREKYASFLQQYQNKLVNLMQSNRENAPIQVNLRGAVYGI